MTDILGNFTCNEGSENEDIKRLFPKCKPKNGGSDINLNKIRDYERYNYNLAVNAKTNKYSSLIDVYQDANKNTDVGVGSCGGSGGTAADPSSLASTPLRRRPRGDNYGSALNNTLALLSPNQNERSLKYDQDHNTTYSSSSSNSISSGGGSVSPRINIGQRRSIIAPTGSGFKGVIGDQLLPMYDCSSAEEKQHMVEDSSVISAYDHCSNMERNGHKVVVGTGGGTKLNEQNVEDEDTSYDNDALDVGYRIPVMREEFKLRESRIEIAGGREVFSTSRSRPPKKRFSDEIMYHRTSDHELKRHTSDGPHNDENQPSRYQGNLTTSRISTEDLSQCSVEPSTGHSNEQKQQNYDRLKTRHNHHVNKIVCNVDEIRTLRNGGAASSSVKDKSISHRGQRSTRNISNAGSESVEGGGELMQYQHSIEHNELQSPKETFILKGQRSGMFIYETVVCGTSEIVYDDIGEWDTDEFARQREIDGSPLMNNRKSNNLDIFQKRLNTSTEAVNSEDVMSEREDGVSSQEGASSHSSGGTVAKVNNGIGGAVVSSKGSLKDVQTIDRDPDDHSSSDEMDTESGQSSSSIKSSVAKLIGSLPIAQYEGSPRRYGPRPGYPQRLTTSEVPCTTTTTIAGQGLGESLPTYSSLFSTVDTQGKCYDVDNSGARPLDQDIPKSLVSKPFVSNCGEITTSSDDNVEELKNGGETTPNSPPSFATYDYQYEESETRKVLEEFYHQDGLFARLKESGTLSVEAFNELEYRLYRVNAGNSYVGRRLAHSYIPEVEDSPKKRPLEKMQLLRDQILSNMAGSGLLGGKGRLTSLSKENVYNFNLERDRLQEHGLILPSDQDGETVSTNPDTEDLAETEIGEQVGQSRNFTLSPETTDCDSNDVESEVSMDNEGSLNSSSRQYASMPVLEDGLSSGHSSEGEHERDDEGGESDHDDRPHDNNNLTTLMMKKQISEIEREIARRAHHKHPKHDLPQLQQHFQQPHVQPSPVDYREVEEYLRRCDGVPGTPSRVCDIDLNTLDPLRDTVDSGSPPPPPAPHPHRPSPPLDSASITCESVSEAINEIKQAIRKTKSITLKSPPMEKPEAEDAPIWVLRPAYKQLKLSKDEGECRDGGGGGGGPKEGHHQEEDECDTDQETDRLLGKQRTEESSSFLEDKRLSESLSSSSTTSLPSTSLLEANSTSEFSPQEKDAQKKKGRTKEVLIHEPAVLIEGVLFRARYLGSTQLVCEGQPTKATRMMQAEEAVSRIKAPEGETQPSTEVDLFISTEKIMVLNTDLKEIMMDHALRTISYIADIGDLVVLMARRRVLSTVDDPEPKLRRTSKMICHVFESEEAQFIAQSIGQAFQVAYMEFLKANGIEDHSFVKEMDYQEVLNSQEIFGDELEMFAKKEMQKEVIVPKLKGEILGVVIVESGWGSMLPTVVIANLSPNGAAARCGQLNIGDQIIAINGISLVGLPLSTCQTYIKSAKNQTVVKLTVVPCAPVVEVKIKRPDTKYQLGFSVQNGVICSLLRGGIAERGGVRVGHRIIEINGQSVVAVPHERIVNLLATSVGEIHMKTMPTSMFRLLTGQESPLFI